MNTSNPALGGVFFDTYAAINKLKKAGASEKLAEAQVELLSRFFEKELVTKGYLNLRLKELESSLRIEMQKIKNEILKWVTVLLIAQGGMIAALVKLL